MKRINFLLLVIAALALSVSCNKVSYKKTKSGLLYKIFPGNSKDSLIKTGNVVKFMAIAKINDSVWYTSYGKMPAFVQMMPVEKPGYDLLEILPLMRKGDSAVTVQIGDTLLNKGVQLPVPVKKGDRLTTTIRILEVYTVDSLARADFEKEMEKDRPRQEKEQQEQMVKMMKEREEQQVKEDKDLEKSGEMAKQFKEVEDYIAAKKITAQKTGKGTYVYIQEQGTGPAATPGKYLNVKYTGRILATDSVFESSTIPLQVGKGAVIRGWDEGLLLFKQGGKGTLFIPGFLAYGSKPGPGSKPFEALVFDVELLSVTDTMPAPPTQTMPRQRN